MNRRSFVSMLPAPLLAAGPLTEPLRAGAAQLIGAALTDQQAWTRLEYVCDRIGARLSGSRALEQAIEWAAAEMRRDGLSRVETPRVMVPHWERGAESAELLEPVAAPLRMLGLGGSVATPREGITAEVVAVDSFDELEALPADRVRGRIVLFNAPWRGYGPTVIYRSNGATRAARRGAVAALVRSVTPASLATPHTGAMRYGDDVVKIPAAALAVEDAGRIARLVKAGVPVKVRLRMEARTLPDAASANVIAELPGREKPEEIVVLGGHLDSWDVGTGAHDDATGCLACWQAVVLMKKLNLTPRRTVRVVLWTNEENGLRGAEAYREWAGATVRNHVAAIEMDGGAERPLGFGLSALAAGQDVQERAVAQAQQVGALLAGIGADMVASGGGGADISPLMREGVPGLGLRTTGEKYFHWHHTHADTVDQVDPEHFRMCMATAAVMAWGLAEIPVRLGA
jgi:carboxypeptidase Q